MRVGVLATRLAGTDGVSLETAKWRTVLGRMGHEVIYCAGELDASGPAGVCVAGMHFRDRSARALGRRAFGRIEPDPSLEGDIASAAAPLLAALQGFVQERRIELLLVENALAIPMQLPLARALSELIASTGLPTIAHHHDFPWERERFRRCSIPQFLERTFPFDAPHVRHVVIHSGAKRGLAERRGIDAWVVPNVFDFATEPPGMDEFNRDFRGAVGLGEDDLFVLQPTRVVPRKGIELAIELVARLGRHDAALVITHEAGDEGLEYLRTLEDLAAQRGVDLRYVPSLVGPVRRTRPDGNKIYSLWDAYPHADLVTYPSSYEGFGNALLEAVHFRRPVLVNRYPVYASDIGPCGFDLVEVEGVITNEAVAAVRTLLTDPHRRRAAVEHNARIGREHFSYEVLQNALESLLASF